MSVCTFTIDKTADDDNSDPVILSMGAVRGEVCRVYGVGNNRHYHWVERCTEHCVLFTGV